MHLIDEHAKKMCESGGHQTTLDIHQLRPPSALSAFKIPTCEQIKFLAPAWQTIASDYVYNFGILW